MREDFKSDYYRMTGKHWSISGWRNFLFMQNIRYMYYWRKRKSAPCSIIAKIFCYLMSRKYGLEISARADIGRGLYLGHAYNITVAAGQNSAKTAIFTRDVQSAAKTEENGRVLRLSETVFPLESMLSLLEKSRLAAM